MTTRPELETAAATGPAAQPVTRPAARPTVQPVTRPATKPAAPPAPRPAHPAPLSHSAALRAKLDLFMPRFFALTSRLWTAPDLRDRYPAYLTVLHGAIRSTVPLMELALERSRALAPGDPVAAGLADYLARHIGEERGHDRWLLEDLTAIGHDTGPALHAMPRGSVANLVGAQYYWIRHHHPVTLLGHIAVLEGYPPSPALTEELRTRSGYPREGFRTLHRHAALDVRHRDELLRTLDRLPLTADQSAAVGLSALHTLDAVIVVFAELLAGAAAADPPDRTPARAPASRPGRASPAGWRSRGSRWSWTTCPRRCCSPATWRRPPTTCRGV